MKSIIYNLTAGEVSPEIIDRTDLAKRETAAAYIENFAVRYAGGLTTVPGRRFVDAVADDTARVVLFSFQFAATLDQAYIVVFNGGKIYFIRDGGYILEDSVATTSISGITVTATGHGFAVGDLVYIDTRSELFKVVSTTTDTFKITPRTGNATDFSSAVAGTARRVYSISHPYTDDELLELRYYQVFDYVRLAHQNHPTMNLIRGVSGWTLEEEVLDLHKPQTGTIAVSSSGKYIRSVRVTNRGTGYTDATTLTVTDSTGTGAVLTPSVASGGLIGVTVVDGGREYTNPSIAASVGSGATFEIILSDTESELIITAAPVVDGKELGIFRPFVATALPNITEAKGTYTYAAPYVAGATSYNFYRSVIYPFENQAQLGATLGWIGSSISPNLTDNNIQPDFSRTAPEYVNPFTPGAIVEITPTNAGSGYARNDTITVTDATGTGAIIYPIVYFGGVVGYYIANSGKNYTAPTITINTSGGTGATATISLRESAGTYPGLAYTHQSRAGYAGTKLRPMTILGSRINEFQNFSTGAVIDGADPYDYTIDSLELSKIRHVVPTRQGLLLLTSSNVVYLTAEDGRAISPLNGVLDTQSFIGASDCAPITIGKDVVYAGVKQNGIQLLVFNENARTFAPTEISILCRHFFRRAEPVSFAATQDQNNSMYVVLSSGQANICTIKRDQQVFAFSRVASTGKFLDVAALDVGNTNHVYFAVCKNGKSWIEYTASPATDDVEEQLTFERAITTSPTTPSADVALDGTSGNINVTASAAIFSSADAGKIFRAGGGRGIVNAVLSATEINVTLTRPLKENDYQLLNSRIFVAGQWYLDELKSTITGIPFEGESLDVIGDGKPLGKFTVVNQTITLPEPVAVAHVGTKLGARVVLPKPVGTEGKSVSINAIAVRARSGNVLFVGAAGTADIPLQLRTNEAWVEPLSLRSMENWTWLDGGWDNESKEVVLEVQDGSFTDITQIVVFYDAADEPQDPRPQGRND